MLPTTHPTIPTDLPCARCHYNLRTLPTDSRCPECHTPVRRTAQLHRRKSRLNRPRLSLGAALIVASRIIPIFFPTLLRARFPQATSLLDAALLTAGILTIATSKRAMSKRNFRTVLTLAILFFLIRVLDYAPLVHRLVAHFLGTSLRGVPRFLAVNNAILDALQAAPDLALEIAAWRFMRNIPRHYASPFLETLTPLCFAACIAIPAYALAANLLIIFTFHGQSLDRTMTATLESLEVDILIPLYWLAVALIARKMPRQPAMSPRSL